MTRIVDSVLVDEDRADQSTELDQGVPVAAVAGETRSFDRKHRVDATFTDCGQQPLEAWTGDASARSSCERARSHSSRHCAVKPTKRALSERRNLVIATFRITPCIVGAPALTISTAASTR